MAEWKYHNELWLIRQEQIAPDRWLLCFRTHDGKRVHGGANGWVNVMKEKWHEGVYNGDALEKFEFITGPLELECICHEMRAKYGDGRST